MMKKNNNGKKYALVFTAIFLKTNVKCLSFKKPRKRIKPESEAEKFLNGIKNAHHQWRVKNVPRI